MPDLAHYARRPCMPLPNEMITAIGGVATDRPAWTWAQLTDAERDRLWDLFLPPALITPVRPVSPGRSARCVAPATALYPKGN